MTISLTDVYRIAHLARVEIDGAHAEEVRAKLTSIFALIDELTAADTTGVEPMAHANAVTNVFRDDQPRRWFSPEEALANAPRQANQLFIVPKVIE